MSSRIILGGRREGGLTEELEHLVFETEVEVFHELFHGGNDLRKR